MQPEPNDTPESVEAVRQSWRRCPNYTGDVQAVDAILRRYASLLAGSTGGAVERLASDCEALANTTGSPEHRDALEGAAWVLRFQQGLIAIWRAERIAARAASKEEPAP